MGQYYVIVNLDKKEFLDPHLFGDGAKLLEFGLGGLTMAGLAVLLATSNGMGGGDLDLEEADDPEILSVPGRWAGYRIAVVGDYGPSRLYHEVTKDGSDYKNVSFLVVRALCEDKYMANVFSKNSWGIDIWKRESEPLPRKVRG